MPRPAPTPLRIVEWVTTCDGRRHASAPLRPSAAADLRRELDRLGHPHLERAATEEEIDAAAFRERL